MKKLYRKLKLLACCVAAAALVSAVFKTLLHNDAENVSAGAGYGDGRPTIILDPGHGGMDGGCVAVNGVPEKGINLSIALETRDILTAFGYNVVLTRDSDVSVHDKGITGTANQKRSDMENRLKLINSYDNAVAVSIHQNQFTDERYSGAQMFYSFSENDLSSERLADTMQKKFVANLQPENTREIKEVGDDLYLLYYSECPMIMAECGFLSNAGESEKLQSEEYQRKVAFTIAGGIMEFIENGC